MREQLQNTFHRAGPYLGLKLLILLLLMFPDVTAQAWDVTIHPWRIQEKAGAGEAGLMAEGEN